MSDNDISHTTKQEQRKDVDESRKMETTVSMKWKAASVAAAPPPPPPPPRTGGSSDNTSKQQGTAGGAAAGGAAAGGAAAGGAGGAGGAAAGGKAAGAARTLAAQTHSFCCTTESGCSGVCRTRSSWCWYSARTSSKIPIVICLRGSMLTPAEEGWRHRAAGRG